MSKNTSVELGEEIAGLVTGQVQSSRYGSASEVIRSGIRLLQDHETKLADLRAALRCDSQRLPQAQCGSACDFLSHGRWRS